ncbi:putative F-box domain, FBD domain, leucine-rich repeat domain, L domain-containing protein [Medicago truncatula]|uniref:F-box/RNI/FBD-like domain protein n=1 Tax=Medicago truncatula TaxID=3880 RepID=G7K562_MEDTR|nr:F-box/RNI/FBD-like domain protein [Medicago truncatula]RHN53385.1 putative F-box domain, FBD domain, leucine-rich repeat domain, L domain-containing protein [Medicago truncatula]
MENFPNLLHQQLPATKRKITALSQLLTVNDLPDEILTHIISFLTFKDAFRTTILSKRWFPLFHTLPIPHIDDKEVKNGKDWIHFRQMLDVVMLSPPAQLQTLKSFHLTCGSKLWGTYCFGFNDWIKAAKHRGVVDLYLNLLHVPLAPTIFHCKTLVVLKLKNLRVNTMFRSSVHLPMLKILCMCSVRFEDKKDLMKLLSGCPQLENLKTRYTKALTNSMLKKAKTINFKPLSKLIKAKIHLFDIPFRAVYNVEFLTVLEMGKFVSFDLLNSYYKGFPVFENLIQLQLVWFYDAIYDWGEIVKMLENCPKLQTLSISKWTKFAKTKADWIYPYHVPQCVSSHLTTCNIIHYQAVEADFRFATYILKNAKLLQVMNISHTSYSASTESSHFLEDLSSCPRISRVYQLVRLSAVNFIFCRGLFDVVSDRKFVFGRFNLQLAFVLFCVVDFDLDL